MLEKNIMFFQLSRCCLNQGFERPDMMPVCFFCWIKVFVLKWSLVGTSRFLCYRLVAQQN